MAARYLAFALMSRRSALPQYEKILKLTSDAKLGKRCCPSPNRGPAVPGKPRSRDGQRSGKDAFPRWWS